MTAAEPHPILRWVRISWWVGAAVAAGCAVGPDYHRPSADVPPTWQPETPWREAAPNEAALKGDEFPRGIWDARTQEESDAAWAASLAAVPILFDAYEIELEHMPLSDTLFTSLLLLMICLAVWWPRPGVKSNLLMGLLAAGTNFFWPDALFRTLAMADEQKLNATAVVGRREIIMGLDGMSRVADPGGNPFADGHTAANYFTIST